MRAIPILLLWLAGACGGSSVDPDASSDASVPASCDSDDDCDDGLFCNGAEACDLDAPGGAVCVSRAGPCVSGQSCEEDVDACVAMCVPPDRDGDGHIAVGCGGDDCDDADADRFPGNAELCDARAHDEDCDSSTFGFRDADGDGAADATCCNVAETGGANCGDDCDDSVAGRNPDNPEVCNALDDDCDDEVDETVLVTFFEDSDGDGFGSAAPGARTVELCGVVSGFSASATDCDDRVASIHPGSTEQCNAADDDCNGSVDDAAGGCDCISGETRACSTDVGRCVAGRQVCSGGRLGACDGVLPSSEACNTEDDDCDGIVDEGVTIVCFPDGDGDGFARLTAASFTTCRDPNPARAVSPFLGCPLGSTGTAPSDALPAPTFDCNDDAGATTTPTLCFRDGDGDMFGAGAPISARCTGCVAGESTSSRDCCDTDATSKPGAAFSTAVNACGSFDRNCSGTVERQFGAPTGECAAPTASGACLCTGGSCTGYEDAIPACGALGSFQSGCERIDEGGFRECVADLEALPRRQGCR